MKYQIHDCGDGRFEIQRVEPVTIGVMYDQGLAHMVLAMMMSMASETEEPAESGEIVLPDALAPALPQTGKTGLPQIGGEFRPLQKDNAAVIPEPAPAEAPAVAKATAQPPSATPETPLQEAFRRLAAGEKLGTVADDVGIPMPQLRGQWARHQRNSNSVPRTDVENCKLCDREFRPSDQSDGLCSRCSREAGGR